MNEHKDDRFTDSALEAALEQTAHEFSSEALRRAIMDTRVDEAVGQTPDDYRSRTATDDKLVQTDTGSSTITSFGESEEVPADLAADSTRPTRRFEISGQVGKGATSRVLAMRDNSLDRTVAVKFLKSATAGKRMVKEHFLHEARVTATLEHPNIMPVYDIGVTKSGRLFFSMKRIEGGTLGDAIRTAKAGEAPPEEFATIDGRVRIFLKICDALTYAHHRGFVHQDIKPDNVMVGRYGEVLVLDWGSAVHAERPSVGIEQTLHGTPAYMSPEQARREHIDIRSDVYCLGATLFHALLLRHPTWAKDPDSFWAKKRGGVIDPAGVDERRRVPSALLDIALKAMHPDPDKRYQTVAELADELKRYQAGLAVAAHRETVVERFSRWYGKNRKVFWTAAAALAVVGISGGLLLREKVQEWITWRKVFQEDFSYQRTSELASNWRAVSSLDWWNMTPEPFTDSGGWRIEDGGLHGYNIDGFHNITYRHRVRGDIRVEWDATPLRLNLNLNCFIAGEHRFGGYTFHIGGFGSPHTCVLTRGSSDHRVDYCELEEGIVLGRTYRFRMEKEGAHVRLSMDGRKLFDYRDPEAYSGTGHQTFGFENNSGNHIRIDNVVVYHHPLPLKTTPLVAADRFFERGYYAEALEEYRELGEVYPHHEIAITALLKSARCLIRLDSLSEAIRTLLVLERRHPKHELAAVAGYERARLLEQQGDSAAAVDIYLSLAERFPKHSVLRAALFEITTDRYAMIRRVKHTWVADSSAEGGFPRWLEREVRNLRRLADAFGVSLNGNRFMEAAAEEYVGSCQADLDDVMRLFGGQRRIIASALMDFDEYERVADEYGEYAEEAVRALYRMGRYRDVLERYPDQRGWVAWSLVRLGEYERVLAEFPDQSEQCALALRLSGRFARLFEDYRPEVDVWMTAAADLGSCADRLEHAGLDKYERASLLVGALGRPDSAISLLVPYESERFDYELLVSEAYRQAGRADAAVRRFSGVPRFEGICGDALIQQGRLDEALTRYSIHDEVCCRALREKGEFEAITRRYPHLRYQTIVARWSQGRTDQLLADLPRRDSLCAAILLATGELESLLRSYPEQREACAHALLLLGRYDELLDSYDDQRMLCARALYAQDLADSAITRYPESRAHHARWLIDKGRYEEAVRRYRDQADEYALALAMLGRYDEIPYQRGLPGVSLETFRDMIHLHALHTAINGSTSEADRILNRPHPFYYRAMAHLRFGEFLLSPILHALAGDNAAFAGQCAYLMEDRQYVFGQRLWYEAGYLLHRISEDSFLDQPFGFRASLRLELMRAIRNDIEGTRGAALRGYRSWAARPDYPLPDTWTDLKKSETVRQFVQWRIRSLGEEDMSTAAAARGPVDTS